MSPFNKVKNRLKKVFEPSKIPITNTESSKEANNPTSCGDAPRRNSSGKSAIAPAKDETFVQTTQTDDRTENIKNEIDTKLSTKIVGTPAELTVVLKPISELWKEAYIELRERDEHLLKDYEDELYESLSGLQVTPTSAENEYQTPFQHEQMENLINQKIKELDDGKWKVITS